MNATVLDLPPTQQIDYKWVSIGETFRPEGLQRPMDEAHVNRIVEKWNDAAFGTPVLSYREHGNRGPRGEAFAIVSGQHRMAAAERVGKTRVFCAVVYGLDTAGEARLFIDEDKRKPQDTIQKFHLSRQAGDADANAIWATLMSKGYSIPKSIGAWPHNGDILSVRAVTKAYHYGVLALVLDALTAAFDRDPAASRAEIIYGLTNIYRFRSATVNSKRLATKIGTLGSGALMIRYRRAQEAAKQDAGWIMANVIVGAYNANWRGDGAMLEPITLAEARKAGGIAASATKAGKTLSEARAEVASKRATATA